MGFRFQRRLNLGGGWGLNTGLSGGSLSYRSRQGSIGTKGLSLRTGIPGLTYRRSWGKNAGAAALVVLAVAVTLGALAIALRIFLFVLPLLWNCLVWVVLTLYDLCVYGVERVKMRRSHSAPPGNSNGVSHVRDAVIGIAVCGSVYLLFSHWFSQAPSTATPSAATAPEKTVQKGLTQPNVAVPIKATHPRRINPTHPATAKAKKQTSANEPGPLPSRPVPPPENDDVVDVRATDAAAAARIEMYCVGATAQATSRQTEIVSRCRGDEAAAWRRLVLKNEFPLLSPAIRKTCTSPPFPQSFVAEEVCARYETNSDVAR